MVLLFTEGDGIALVQSMFFRIGLPFVLPEMIHSFPSYLTVSNRCSRLLPIQCDAMALLRLPPLVGTKTCKLRL